LKNLTDLVGPNVSLIDKTSDLKITGSTDPVDRFRAIDTIVDKGFIRFGCYAATTDATDKSVDGAVAMLLAFNAPNEAESTTVDKAILLRPIYTSRIVTAFIVSVNRSQITAVLNSRNFDCNGFTVEKPKPAPSG
jgi:hypothetical protein